MKCEQCGKEIPEVVMVHKAKPLIDKLSSLAVVYRLFCSDECQRQKQAEDHRKREHPH